MSRTLAQPILPKPDRLVDSKAVCDRLGISLRTLYRWLENSKLPQPIRKLSRRMHWRESAIDQFLQDLDKSA